MVAWGYEISLLVLRNISRVSAAIEGNIIHHSKRNFVSPRGHVISSISIYVSTYPSDLLCVPPSLFGPSAYQSKMGCKSTVEPRFTEFHLIGRFLVTSRPPYWFTKTMKQRNF